MQGLTKLSKEIRFDNASKGFDPTEGGVERYLLLSISELCEAQNELRDGHEINEVYYPDRLKEMGGEISMAKPEGFPVEVADAIIRLLDIGAKFDYNFDNKFLPIWTYKSIDDYLLKIIQQIAGCTRYAPEDYEFQASIKVSLASLFNLCELNNIAIMPIIHEKLAFNRSRPPKHGRKF